MGNGVFLSDFKKKSIAFHISNGFICKIYYIFQNDRSIFETKNTSYKLNPRNASIRSFDYFS